MEDQTASPKSRLLPREDLQDHEVANHELYTCYGPLWTVSLPLLCATLLFPPWYRFRTKRTEMLCWAVAIPLCPLLLAVSMIAFVWGIAMDICFALVWCFTFRCFGRCYLRQPCPPFTQNLGTLSPWARFMVTYESKQGDNSSNNTVPV